jgi:hypothetical protein
MSSGPVRSPPTSSGRGAVEAVRKAELARSRPRHREEDLGTTIDLGRAVVRKT